MDNQEPFSTRIYESSINYLMINYLIARDIRERPHFLTFQLRHVTNQSCCHRMMVMYQV